MARTWLLAATLIMVTVGLRLPTWNDHILFIDEPYYHSVALRLAVPGTHLYPPPIAGAYPLGPLSFLATATYWLAIKISALHAITVVHVFTTVAIATTAVLLLLTGQCFLGGPWAGWAAGLLYALVSTSDRGDRMYFGFSGLEHFQAPFLAAFVLAFLRGLQRDRASLAAAAGAALGVAALYKINVIVLFALPWVVAALVWQRTGLRLRRAAALAAVATLAGLVTAGTVPVFYALTGQFAAWRFYNIEMMSTYSTLGGSFMEKVVLLAANIPLKPLLAAGLLYGALVTPRWNRSSWESLLGTFLALTWLLLFFSLTPGHRKPHYLIQGLPAECLLIGMLVVGTWRYARASEPRVRTSMTVLYVALVGLPLTVATYDLLLGWQTLARFAEHDAYLDIHRSHGTLGPLVRYIQSHSQPDDLLYVHSEAPELYFLTQRRPAASDPVGSWIAHMPTRQHADTLLAELQATPPKLIVQLDYRRYGRTGETLQKWPQIAAWLKQHYREHAHIDHVQILERRDPDEDSTPTASGAASGTATGINP